MPRSPKESFLLSGKVEAWKKVVSSVPELDTACDYALLQLQYEMPGNIQPGVATDPYIGMDANAQMHGARRVLDILRTLHEPTKQATQPKRETLHY